MAKRDRTADRLDELARLRSVSDAAVVRPVLADALGERVNLIVERAAKMAMKNHLADLAPAMSAAFDRFMENAAKTDPGCAAKTAIVEALVKFNADCRELYLRGLHHHQHEPVWGGSRDTAAKLRGLCALGLVALGYRDVLYELADLIFDEDPEARLLACRALSGTGVDSAALLLRAKLAAGKDSSEIFGECFASLLTLQPNRSIDLIAKYLSDPDIQMVEAAALSIGSSRNPRAFELLRDGYAAARAVEAKAAILLGIGLTRDAAAIDMLIGELENAQSAGDAAAALRIFRNDPAAAARIEAAIASKNNAAIQRRWRNG
jgi:hypothetical protein